MNARAQFRGFWNLSLEGTCWVWRQVLLILFSSRAPECAPLKSKMIYASSKDAIKKKLTASAGGAICPCARALAAGWGEWHGPGDPACWKAASSPPSVQTGSFPAAAPPTSTLPAHRCSPFFPTGIKHELQANCYEEVKDRCTLAEKLGGSAVISLEGKPL